MIDFTSIQTVLLLAGAALGGAALGVLAVGLWIRGGFRRS